MGILPYSGKEVPALGLPVPPRPQSLGLDWGDVLVRSLVRVVNAVKPTPGSLMACGGIPALPLASWVMEPPVPQSPHLQNGNYNQVFFGALL